MSTSARVWVILAKGVGDNNQLLRLANELGLPFRTIVPEYNRLHLVPPRILGATLASLSGRSRAQIRPPWPDLVLGIGYRSVPAALAIRELSGGRSKLVRVGNPRVDPAKFDLVITTSQYSVPDSPTLLRLDVGLNTMAKTEPDFDERRWMDKLPRPHRLLLIGGDTFMWKLSPGRIAAAAKEIAGKPGGSVVAVSSHRSGKAALHAVAAALAGTDHALVWGKFPRYPVLIEDADELYVTADSVSMISDAVTTGNPVGLVLPEKSIAGRVLYPLERLGLRVPIRDVRAFWTSVQERQLVGTVEHPMAGNSQTDPLHIAVSAIRALL